MISSLILYTIRYNIKSWQGIIILLSSLLSMSLASYMLLFLGMIIYKLSLGNFFKTITLFLMIIMTCTLIYSFLPNSYFSQAILLRLEYDKDKGFIGNNRTTEGFEYYYDNKFYKTESVLWGIGSDLGDISDKGGNSSYKVFIVQHGILGLVLLALFLLLLLCILNLHLLKVYYCCMLLLFGRDRMHYGRSNYFFLSQLHCW